MQCARAESRDRSKPRRRETRRHMSTNNNNSDSGYFAYSNNRMPFSLPLSLSPSPFQISRQGAKLEAVLPWSRRISLRLASYQKFICLPTNSSKSIDSTSEASSSLEEIYLPAVYLELLLMLYHYRPASQPWWPSKANSASDSNPTFIADINSFNSLILNI